jgi:hypothetical protein
MLVPFFFVNYAAARCPLNALRYLLTTEGPPSVA